MSTATATKNTNLGIFERAHEISKCKRDPIYFINTYLKIYEPRPQFGQGWKSFELWPKQVDYIQFLEDNFRAGKGAKVEKCRDMGATLTTVAWFFWHWRFSPNFAALLVSLREEEVKKVVGVNNPLFSKLDGFIKNLPDWLLPKGFDYDKHSLVMTLINPENGSSIDGSSLTPTVGRSKRYSAILLDENEFYPPNIDAVGNCKFSSDTVIQVSTVNGMAYLEDVEQAKELGEFFEMYWNDNPMHDTAWLDTMRKGLKRHVFNREIMRDRTASAAGLVYPEIADCELVDFEYNPRWPLYTFSDFGYNDPTTIGFLQVDPDTLDWFLLDEVVNNLKTIHFYIPFFPGTKAVQHTYRYTDEEREQIREHKTWKKANRHFGDVTSAKYTNQATGDSTYKVLKEHGIIPRVNEVAWRSYDKRTDAGRLGVQRLKINKRLEKGNKPGEFRRAFMNTRYPEKSDNSTSQNEKYIHKGADFCTAFEALCITLTDRQIKADIEAMQQIASSTSVRYVPNPWEFR